MHQSNSKKYVCDGAKPIPVVVDRLAVEEHARTIQPPSAVGPTRHREPSAAGGTRAKRQNADVVTVTVDSETRHVVAPQERHSQYR